MNCPYCAEEIKDDALICRYCGSDVALAGAIFEQLRSAFAQISELSSKVQNFDEPQRSIGDPVIDHRKSHRGGLGKDNSDIFAVSFARSFLTTFVLLLLSYAVLIIEIGVHEWLFRLIVIVLSIAFAFADTGSSSRSVSSSIFLALLLGVFSVLGMDSLNSLKFGGPMLAYFDPLAGNKEKWGDFVNQFSHMASIAFSYLTGTLALHFLRVRVAEPKPALSSGLATAIASKLGRGVDRIEDFEKHARTTQTYLNTAILIVTTLTAVFTGLHNMMT